MSEAIDLNKVVQFITRVAEDAGKIIMSYYKEGFQVHGKGSQKDGIDIVTDADRSSEDYIMHEIKREFPDHDILTEETVTETTGSRWMWVVDPLDGTVNFSHGYPVFSVSIALMEKQELIVGVVHDPSRFETFSAVRGGGALLNGEPIAVSKADSLTRSIIATGFPYDRATSPVNNVEEFNRMVTRVQGIRRGGSAALDLSYVACGRLDGFWELKLKPWDMAAGMLLVKEAGGTITDRHGITTTVYTDSIVAANSRLHEILVGLLAAD